MKKLIQWVLVIGLAVVFVNDLGRWVQASYNLDNHLREVADNASATARQNAANPQGGWPAADETARKYGIQVIGYSQQDQEVVVVAKAPVTGTWVTGPVIAIIGKQPYTTPFYVEARAKSYFH